MQCRLATQVAIVEVTAVAEGTAALLSEVVAAMVTVEEVTAMVVVDLVAAMEGVVVPRLRNRL